MEACSSLQMRSPLQSSHPFKVHPTGLDRNQSSHPSLTGSSPARILSAGKEPAKTEQSVPPAFCGPQSLALSLYCQNVQFFHPIGTRSRGYAHAAAPPDPCVRAVSEGTVSCKASQRSRSRWLLFTAQSSCSPFADLHQHLGCLCDVSISVSVCVEMR